MPFCSDFAFSHSCFPSTTFIFFLYVYMLVLSPLSRFVWAWRRARRSKVNLLLTWLSMCAGRCSTLTHMYSSSLSCEQSPSWTWPVTHRLTNTSTRCSCPSVTTGFRNVMVADLSLWPRLYLAVLIFTSVYPSPNPSISLLFKISFPTSLLSMPYLKLNYQRTWLQTWNQKLFQAFMYFDNKKWIRQWQAGHA